jgi:hypothetical protein
MMGRTAGFHTDETLGQLGEEGQHVLAPERLGDNHAPRSVNAMNLKNMLGQIKANSRDRRHRRSFRAHVVAWAMKPISYARHRFPPDVIRHAVWLYLRFTLSYRDVEDLLAARGLTVSNESIRRWVLKFGPMIARNLRTIRPKPYTRWHLDEDEMVVSLSGKQMYMWRAIDGEGEIA